MKELSPQKIDRIHKIITEATEQSRGRKLPEIQQIENLNTLKDLRNFQIFDLPSSTHVKAKTQNTSDLPLL